MPSKSARIELNMASVDEMKRRIEIGSKIQQNKLKEGKDFVLLREGEWIVPNWYHKDHFGKEMRHWKQENIDRFREYLSDAICESDFVKAFVRDVLDAYRSAGRLGYTDWTVWGAHEDRDFIRKVLDLRKRCNGGQKNTGRHIWWPDKPISQRAVLKRLHKESEKNKN